MELREAPARRAGPPPPGWLPGKLPWLLALAGFALAIRVAYVLVVLPEYSPVSDAHHYHTLAQAVAEGRGFVHTFPFGFEHPTAFRPPLYPMILGALYALTGVKLGAAQVLNVLLGTVVVLEVAVLGWRLAGPRAGIAAGLLAAVFPPLLANDGPPLSEPLGLALMLSALLALAWERTVLAGVAVGLMMLTRPSAQFLVVALGLWIAWRLGWRRAVGFTLVAALVVAPWIGRNWAVLGSPLLVTSNGFNLTASYSPESMSSGGFADAVFDPRFAALREGITNEAELDKALRDYGVASVRADPVVVPRVLWRNAQRLFEIRAADNVGAETLDGRSIRVRGLALPFVRLALLVGAVGLVMMRRRPGAGPLLLTVLVLTAASVASIPAPRLRAPYDIGICIAIGVLVASLPIWKARRPTRA